jgi:succinoglycan biosynthesis transport protein ExoP
MPEFNSNLLTPAAVLRLLREYHKRWILSTLAVLVGVGAFVVLKSDSWEATQAVMVRNTASTTLDSPGKFHHDDEMKTTQETILEVARSRAVISEALLEVGPPADFDAKQTWPDALTIDDYRSAVKLSPPKGAEFGKTEVFYLQIKDSSRLRALALVESIGRHLDAHLAQLRDAKAQSMQQELVKTVALAEADLNESTQRLAQMEKQVGPDLVELRMLHQSPGGDGDLNRTAIDAQNELRQARTALRINEKMLALLKAAQKDPRALLAAPTVLLDSQPALKRLKEGLVDSQLRTAAILGTMTDTHPQVLAAKQSETTIHQSIFKELDVAIRAVQSDMELNQGRLAVVEAQSRDLSERLDRLASLRAEYSNLANEVEHRRTLLQQAQRHLSEVKASQATAHSASLISFMDSPETGSKPQGPSRAMILAAGILGAFAFGVGVVILTAPSLSPMTEVGSERVYWGRTGDRGHHPNGSSVRGPAPEPRKNGHPLVPQAPDPNFTSPR